MTLLDPPDFRTEIPGRPRPQGSMTLWKAPDGSERAKYSLEVVLHRNLVVGLLREAWGDLGPMASPVAVQVTAEFQRPASHMGTGRNAGTLKPGAPEHMWQTPDVDKLARLVLDALTIAGVIADDRYVSLVTAEKVWGITDRTIVEIWRLEEEAHAPDRTRAARAR